MEHKIVNCPHCGRIIPEYVLNGELIKEIVTCPQCGSKETFKAGKRKTINGLVQRYICRECAFRFS